MERAREDLYSALPLHQDEIRILTILPSAISNSQVQCKLKTVSLKQHPSYKALSYTWGIRNETHDVVVNGYSFPAFVNLQAALQHFRTTESEVDFWVDAICIDQENSTEKNGQLTMMRKVFSEAKETWVWLGVEKNECDKAVDTIGMLSAFYLENCFERDGARKSNADVAKLGFPEQFSIDCDIAIESIFARNYWYRIWVVQEIAVSRNVTLFCGKVSFSWEQVLNTAYFLDARTEVHEILRKRQSSRQVILSRQTNFQGDWQTSSRNIYSDSSAAIKRIISIQSVRNGILKSKGYESDAPDSLLFLLVNHRSAESTEAKDKYIALAGLVEHDSIGFLPPKKNSAKDSIGDIYTWAAQSIARQHQSGASSGLALDFLDCAGLPKKNKVDDIPSWVPDWSHNSLRAVPLLYWQFSENQNGEILRFNAPGRTSKPTPILQNTYSFPEDRRYLRAEGIKFDTVSGVGFSVWSSFDASHVRNPAHCTHQEYPTGESLTDVVWKTCVSNRTPRGKSAPTEWGNIFHVMHHNQQWYSCNTKFKICGRTLEEITVDKMLSSGLLKAGDTHEGAADANLAKRDYLSTFPEDSTLMIWNSFADSVRGRRLATTEKGYLCLAPYDTAVGDTIAILSDCQVPVVLRGKGDHYEFIGSCYVHGIMHGEACKLGLSSMEFNIR